ncbi:MAG: prenyltransferase [Gammaproteobacteria bacterium]|nr:prenyltransferase [Gammaproteobacteria bacterium]MBQ0840325.1 prenyltransferase [Gammaproteobacteria bacterium]
MSLKILLQTFRPSFLILSFACVFLGFSTTVSTQTPINITAVLLILVGALSAHISVNTLNEYADYKSGLDFLTKKTAFSGGSGALVQQPKMATAVLVSGLVALTLTIIIGLFFIREYGAQILPIGIAGVLLIISYTPWLNRSPFLCLIAPGLGFGVLMVVGTHVLLAGSHSALPWLVSTIPFCLNNNLLLLNQYPDIDADKHIGRRTFPIAYGTHTSNWLYAGFMLLACVFMTLLIIAGQLPTLSTIALAPLPLSAYALLGAWKHDADIGQHPKYLAANVATAVLTPLLLGISIMWA